MPTIYFDFTNGITRTAYPCRCGQTHEGEHGFDDWQHHDCLHDTTLILCDEGFVICPNCGNSWDVRNI